MAEVAIAGTEDWPAWRAACTFDKVKQPAGFRASSNLARGSRQAMRWAVLLCALLPIDGPAWAQEAQPSAPPSTSAEAQPSSTKDAPSLNLPVSLDRIREALEQQPQSRLQLREQPTFRVEVRER